MSTVTPSRPAAPRTGASRTRMQAATTRAANIDPFRVLRRHLLWIILSVFVGAALGGVSFFLLKKVYPLYTGQVVFEIQSGVREAAEVGAGDPLRDDDVYRMAKTELVLLVDRSVLGAAANDPRLQKSEWFMNNFVAEDGSLLVAEAVDKLEDSLDVDVVRGTELFEAGWSAHVREDVPKILDAVADAYLSRVEMSENEVYNTNLESFNNQLMETTDEIDSLDDDIKRYIADHDIQSMVDSRYHTAAYALRAITQQIEAARSGQSIAYTNYLQIAAKIEGTLEYSPEDILEAEMDYAVVNHVRTEEAMKVELRVLRDQYNGDHMMIRKAENRLAASAAERKAKIEEVIKRNLHAKLKMFAAEMEKLQQAIDTLEEETDKESEVLRTLASEQSVFQSKLTKREYLEESRAADSDLIKEIKMMKFRADASRVRLYQRAITPRELSFPRPEIMVPLGVLVVLALTVGVIFIREITDQRVKTASDLSILPGARVLGVIPDLDDDPTKCGAAEMAIRKFPNSVLAESYRQACTPILKGIDHVGHQTVVFLGGLPGAGTTTTMCNVAAGFAGAGRKVLVVDGNFRRPRLAGIMGIEADGPGLGDLLAGSATLDETIAETEFGVSVLPAGTPATRIIERLNTLKLDSLVAEMRGRFDLVLFDAPPAVVAGDALVLANKLDAAVLIVRANREHRGLVARLMNQLSDTKCELLGLLLNRPRGTAGGYFKKNFATMAAYGAKAS